MQHCCIKITKMKPTRNTVAKTEIQQLIVSSSIALSHVEIQKKLEGLCDRVTIYRVLDRLIEEGSIHKIVNTDGGVKYAGCRTCTEKHNHNHIHFSCHKCKSVTCLEGVEPIFKLPKNYRVSEVNFTLSGVCPNCN